MATTLRDLAERLGVSKTLVSRVLNNKAGVRVSEATRQRIIETALRMEYRPSVLARALVSGRTRQLAISSADSDWQIGGRDRLAEVVGFVQGAARNHFRVLVIASPDRQANPDEFDSLIHSYACDGFCIYAEQAIPALYHVLQTNGTPFVVVGNPGDPELPQIDQDNFRYAYESVRWLSQQGRHRIAFIYPFCERQLHVKELRHGYQEAMEAFCGGYDASLIPDHYPGHEERLAMLSREHPPTAIILEGVSDLIDWKRTLASIGMGAPDDITLLVHTDTLEMSYLRPGDACHIHDPAAVGAAAAEALIQWIENNGERPGRILVPTLGPQWFAHRESDQEHRRATPLVNSPTALAT